MKKVLCLDKYSGNFTYGKVYKAVPFATMGLGKNKQLSNFRVTDDEGDYYTIAMTVDSLGKKWKWLD